VSGFQQSDQNRTVIESDRLSHFAICRLTSRNLSMLLDFVRFHGGMQVTSNAPGDALTRRRHVDLLRVNSSGC
jgi:hypothetical protein